ncbi:aldose 1-epimerase family protein [Belnapia sp. T6]|uniref:Aldose 1-epimerase family protein n=1 Tax=Belnapia mucosa TaxID=2804532 RepID=A0ABS1V872_9PROT|nr:aldose 1-epimerase family protein [Belnapia mucosa]MBL6457850.1 aldose 1-epimerase family protein [Belnapia mucosa]
MRIAAAGIAAEIKPQGAELCRLQDGAGRDFLWEAGPTWPRHSPVLFPIIGKLAGDAYRHAGQRYAMTQHGFARDRDFTPIAAEADRCAFRLTDDAATREAYPFAFALELHYAVAGSRLRVEYVLSNSGEEALPASLGAHPAFRWPLPGAEGEPHAILFDQPEPAPVRRLSGGLLEAAPVPTPIQDRRLDLEPGLFAADALILDRVASRGLDYRAAGGAGLRFEFSGFPVLALWCRPGAGFLCIEPWQGFHSPEGWDGDFAEKPGVVSIPPGGEFRAGWSVTLG